MKLMTLFLMYVISQCSSDIISDWENFKMRYNKQYRNPQEEKRRMRIFQDNLDAIDKHNEDYEQGLVSFEMGMNQYGDKFVLLEMARGEKIRQREKRTDDVQISSDYAGNELSMCVLPAVYPCQQYITLNKFSQGSQAIQTQDEFEEDMLGKRRRHLSEEITEISYQGSSTESSFSSENIVDVESEEQESTRGRAKRAIHFGLEKNFSMYMKILSRITSRAKIILSALKELKKHQRKSIDWNKLGAVTPAVDQGACGSCWAFSTVGALEGHLFIKMGRLEALSVQQLVDCTKIEPYKNNGCHGGLMDASFMYISLVGGIASETDYPYESKSLECRFNGTARATCLGYLEVSGHDAILESLHRGPVCVVLDASTIQFRFYKSGIYASTLCSERRTNHAVVAVGFGEENGRKYWLVKNSWGTTWGENGLFKVSRRHSCGINKYGIYPIV